MSASYFLAFLTFSSIFGIIYLCIISARLCYPTCVIVETIVKNLWKQLTLQLGGHHRCFQFVEQADQLLGSVCQYHDDYTSYWIFSRRITLTPFLTFSALLMDDLCGNFTSRAVFEELEPLPFAPEGFADGTSKGLAWLDCCCNWLEFSELLLEFSILVASALPLGAMLSTLRGRFKNSWQLKLHLRTFGHLDTIIICKQKIITSDCEKKVKAESIRSSF